MGGVEFHFAASSFTVRDEAFHSDTKPRPPATRLAGLGPAEAAAGAAPGGGGPGGAEDPAAGAGLPGAQRRGAGRCLGRLWCMLPRDVRTESLFAN